MRHEASKKEQARRSKKQEANQKLPSEEKFKGFECNSLNYEKFCRNRNL
jgi:hypothetical protein